MLPSQLWGTLWGLASCSHTPPESWMDRFLGRCEAVMGESAFDQEGGTRDGRENGTGGPRRDGTGRDEGGRQRMDGRTGKDEDEAASAISAIDITTAAGSLAAAAAAAARCLDPLTRFQQHVTQQGGIKTESPGTVSARLSQLRDISSP